MSKRSSRAPFAPPALAKPGPSCNFLTPRLTRKAIHVKQSFKDLHLVQVLKAAEIRRTKQAKEQRALQIELGQWRCFPK
jgi:hypothetical protein